MLMRAFICCQRQDSTIDIVLQIAVLPCQRRLAGDKLRNELETKAQAAVYKSNQSCGQQFSNQRLNDFYQAKKV